MTAVSARSRRGLATWITRSTAPVFVLDERQVVVVFNHGCEQLTGRAAADVIGQTCVWQTADDAADLASLTGQLCPPSELATNGGARTTVSLRTSDGSIVARTIHFFQLPGEEADEPAHALGFITPVVDGENPANVRADYSRLRWQLRQKYGLSRVVATSSAMRQTLARAGLAKLASTPVQFIGERGVGKEHLARAIHFQSSYIAGRFIPLRCRTSTHFELQRTLRRLAEESPEPGTTDVIYLDHVDHLPLDLQVLVREQFERPHVRWMSSVASPDSQSQPQLDGELRAALGTLCIEVPALRQRPEDLPFLTLQLIEEGNTPQGRQVDGITPAVERLFQLYRWPGNVEELAKVLEAAARRCESGQVDVPDLPLMFRAGFDAQQVRPVAGEQSLEQLLEEFERSIIQRALAEAQGNKSLTADRLGIPRPRLYRRLEALGLVEPSGDSEE